MNEETKPEPGEFIMSTARDIVQSIEDYGGTMAEDENGKGPSIWDAGYCLNKACNYITSLEAKNKKLKEAFLGYASHDMDCPRNWPNNPEGRGCTCGFDEAKKGQ